MSYLGEYDVGDQPRFTATYRDAAGALNDPSSVKFISRQAGGTQTVYTYLTDDEVTRTSLGVFLFVHPRLAAADAGKTIYVRSNGDGPATASDEDHFKVRTTNFATPLP